MTDMTLPTAAEIEEAALRAHDIVLLPVDPNRTPLTPEQRAAIESELQRTVESIKGYAYAYLTQHSGAGDGQT